MDEHDEYIWLRDKVSRFEMVWPICASLVFHVLLVLILTTTSTYYPAVGTVAQFDIFWVTPAAMPPDILAAGVPPPAEPAGSQQDVVISEQQPKVGIAAIPAAPPVFPDVGQVRLASAEVPEEAAEVEEPVVSMVSEKAAPAPKKARAAPKKALQDEQREEPPKMRKVSTPQQEPVRKPAAIIPAQAWQSDAQPDSQAAEKAEAQRLSDLQDERRRIAREKEDRLGIMALNDKQAPRPAEEPSPSTGPDRPAEKRQEDQAAQQELSEKAARENAERERVSKRQAQVQEERNRQKAQQAVLDQAAREKAQRKQRVLEQARLSREQEERNRQAFEQERREKLAREKAEKVRVAEQARLSREQEEAKQQTERRTRQEKAEREKAERESAARARIAAEKLQREGRAAALAERKIEQTRLAAWQKSTARPQANPGPEGGARQRQKEAATAQKPSAPPAGRVDTAGNKAASINLKPAEPAAEKVAAKPSEKPRQERGFVIASMHGDLKLVIAGDDSIKLGVRFRDYPKSRRSKVLTRAEARREQTIMPVLVRTRPDTREAVIETAREGIYIFSAEPGQAKGAKATFTLKVFESGTRERIAPLGSRTISGTTVLLKILMPEAILWNDESAFTGYLEDSESETKFNATTGLYWKEFHD